MPSNFATKKVTLGSLVASIKIWGNLQCKSTKPMIIFLHYNDKCFNKITNLVFDNKITNCSMVLAEETRNWSCSIVNICRFSCSRERTRSLQLFLLRIILKDMCVCKKYCMGSLFAWKTNFHLFVWKEINGIGELNIICLATFPRNQTYSKQALGNRKHFYQKTRQNKYKY